jgi:hypothetical protein
VAGAVLGLDESLALVGPAKNPHTPATPVGSRHKSMARKAKTPDSAVAETSRCRPIDPVVAEKMMICSSHFPWPGLGKAARDGGGCALILHTG